VLKLIDCCLIINHSKPNRKIKNKKFFTGGLGFLGSGAMIFVLIPLLGIIIGGVLVMIGIAYFVMAYGLWNGRRWAWKLTLILSGIGIIVGIGSIVVGNVGSLFHTIINAIVIFYLYRPNVKDYFGR
jgi:hypothetical protein